MVKLSETPGRKLEDGGGAAYIRCFGDRDLGHLLSRVQSLIIKNGYELEALIIGALGDKLIKDLDEFLTDQIMDIGIKVATKKVVKKSYNLGGHQIEPDFIVFERSRSSQNCYIIELKDGHEFDTKSSAKEQANLHQFITMNAMPLQYYQTSARICGFNAETKEEIYHGFKQRIDINQAMTGREFCQLVGIDYDSIASQRASDRAINLEDFITELAQIESVRAGIQNRFGG